MADPAKQPALENTIADPSGYGDPSVGAELARHLAEAQTGAVALGLEDGGRFVVGTVDEIPPGSRKLIVVDGREIGVFNVDGEYFAVLNRCPHQGGPLCSGRQTGFLVAPTPGDYQLSRPGEVIRCPWHGWEFDLRTGQSWCEPARVRVRRYDVAVEPGATLAEASEPGMEGLVKGPYVAETFPVSVEQEYVVVEIG
jgi:nitrite reductase/ring-hydroxylating ferredoxin subunit